jgi:hypothetical protein
MSNGRINEEVAATIEKLVAALKPLAPMTVAFSATITLPGDPVPHAVGLPYFRR